MEPAQPQRPQRGREVDAHVLLVPLPGGGPDAAPLLLEPAVEVGPDGESLAARRAEHAVAAQLAQLVEEAERLALGRGVAHAHVGAPVLPPADHQARPPAARGLLVVDAALAVAALLPRPRLPGAHRPR